MEIAGLFTLTVQTDVLEDPTSLNSHKLIVILALIMIGGLLYSAKRRNDRESEDNLYD